MVIGGFVLLALFFLWSIHVHCSAYFRGWVDCSDYWLQQKKPMEREAYPEMYGEEDGDDGES